MPLNTMYRVQDPARRSARNIRYVTSCVANGNGDEGFQGGGLLVRNGAIGNRSWGINLSVLVGGDYGNNLPIDDDSGAVQVGVEILHNVCGGDAACL